MYENPQQQNDDDDDDDDDDKEAAVAMAAAATTAALRAVDHPVTQGLYAHSYLCCGGHGVWCTLTRRKPSRS